MSEQPYDPYIPSGSNGATGTQATATHGGDPKTQQVSREIDDTIRAMRSNIVGVSERGERLDSLQDKTDNLATSAQGFRRGANRVRKQMWWKDMKMRVCLVICIIILLVVIIVPSGDPAILNISVGNAASSEAAASPRSKDDTNTFPLDGVDIASVSNEELVRLERERERERENENENTASVLYQISSSKVLRISQDLVLKCGPLVLPGEGRALEFVRAKTSSVLVPRVYRSFQVDDSFEFYGTRGYLVMDYIKGQDLGDCWIHLRKDQKDDVIRQTAAMIQQLQSIPIPTAGSLGGGPCRGRFFTDYGAGPFDSGTEMQAWFNHKLKICKHYNHAPPDIPSFDFQGEFVLVHQDISPRNMILDAAGRVWLVDWAHAGAYPRAFERAAIAGQYRFPEFNRMMLQVLPEYDVEEQQLQSIWYGLSIASLA